MARQIIYANDSDVTALDRLTGIDSLDRSTKNFTIEAIAQLFASTGLADVSKLAFFFNYNAGNSASLRGQAYYRFLGGNLDNTPAGINEIIFNRYDSAGKDFEPLAGSIRGSHIKLTAVGNAADTNYGLYEVLTNPTISGSTITVSVRHLASSGTLPNDEISISVLSSTATGTGVSVTDGEDPPVANATNHEGDLYIQIQEHETEVGQHQVNIWLYKNGVWVNEANLTGRQGEMGIQGFQGVSIEPGTASGDNTTVGQPTTFTVDLRNDDPNGPQNQTLQFTVPAGAKGDTGANLNGALLNFTENGANIDVTYDTNPVGSFPAPADGRSITDISLTGTAGLVDTYTITYSSGDPDTFTVTNGTDGDTITVARNTADNGITVTSSGGTAQDVLDGADGDTVTVTRNAADDGVTITSSGGTSQDILDGVVGDTITVERNTADDGITVTSSGGTSQDVLDGSDGDTIAVARNAANTGITVTSSGGDSQDVLDGIQGSITFRYYRGVPFTDPDPAPVTISVTAGGLINVIPDWDHNGVPSTYDPSTENLWIAEYIWDPADEDETELLYPFKETGPQGPGSGSSDVDGIKVEGTTLSLDESGTAVGITVPIAQGAANNDTLAGQGYVDDGLGNKEDTISATNRVDAEFVGTGVITNTEFNTLDGVTSSIQTQLDARVDTTGDEDIAGVKTFTSTPKGANPADDSNDTSLATTNWVRGHIGTGGAGATNLGVDSRTNISLDVTSSNGNDATVPQATTSLAGLLNAEDKDKLDTVERNADQTPTWVPDVNPGYVTGIPTNLINGQNLAAAQNTLGINPDAEQNVKSDWLASSGDAEILNKPDALSDFDNDENFIDIHGQTFQSLTTPTRRARGVLGDDIMLNSGGALRINLEDFPIKDLVFERRDSDDVRIRPDGTLQIWLATPNISGLTYGFTPNQFEYTDGMIPDIPITVALTGLDANHTAEITSITPITGFTFNIDTAGTPPRQFFTMEIDESVINAGFNQNILPTVTSTEIGTGTVETNTTVSIPFSVIAPVAAPVQSNYFYYGVTNNIATSGDDIDDLVVLVDQISNTLDSDGNGEPRSGGDYTVQRDRTDQGNKDISFLGQNVDGTLIEFIAVPDTITPSFIELVDGHQYPAPFDADRIQGNAMINSVTYNIYKGVNDQGAEYIITF